MEYSNAVKELTIDNWPYGRKQVQCIFTIEAVKGKERAVRVTQNPKGGWNKPKKLTYAHKVRIVTGDDDKTYLMNLTAHGAISVMQSNMKYQQEYICDDDSRYKELLSFFND